MNHEVPAKTLRLKLLEGRAEAHHQRAMESGNAHRASRAAKLLEAVDAKLSAIARAEVSPYRS